MRVISGSARGRRLYTPEKLKIRPTSDKVKESLFNVLGASVQESRFLDICAGSGAVGIEALSRGAREVVFIDSNRDSIALVEKNIKLCGFCSSDYPRVRIVAMEGERAVERFAADGVPFDFVFLDTPYHETVLEGILEKVSLYSGLVDEYGQLIVEHYYKRDIPERLGTLILDKTKKYGDTLLSYYLHGA